MINGLMLQINDDTTLLLSEKKANIFFLKTLIRFFDKKEILFKMSMEDDYNQEEVNKFKGYFSHEFSDDNHKLLSDKEKEIFKNIIMMMFYTIKDDFIIDLKEIS